MASQIIGRTACPECGFGSAHVKKSDKCHYRYCPECYAQYHAKTERQVADLLAKTRLAEPVGMPTPTPTEAAAAPAPADPATPAPPPTPTAASRTDTPAKRHRLFG